MQQHCACAFLWGCICYKAQKGGFFTRRILCGKEHEVGVGVDGLLQLWHKQLPVVVQEPVKHRHIDVWNVVVVQSLWPQLWTVLPQLW